VLWSTKGLALSLAADGPFPPQLIVATNSTGINNVVISKHSPILASLQRIPVGNTNFYAKAF
jgi:hypothetical protein